MKHALRVVAQVDSEWAQGPDGLKSMPESHLVQARTNATWKATKDNVDLVTGRLWYPSHKVAMVNTASGHDGRRDVRMWFFSVFCRL